MNEKQREETAYLRYSIILPLLDCNGRKTLGNKLKEQAGRFWPLPDGRMRQFAWGTIEKWLYNYKRYGMDGLRDAPRRDTGAFREMPVEVSEELDRLLEENPGLKSSVLIKMLSFRSILCGDRVPSRSTLYRYIRSRRPAVIPKTAKERRSFEAPYSGSLWQTDIMYGPYIKYRRADGKRVKKQTYLVAIIDDHSRLIVHGEFFLSQDLTAYLKTLKTAILKRGIPEKIYCDNGQVFLSGQIKRIAAEIGSVVIHTKVRDAEAKGKIERFFKTVRDRFLAPLYAEKTVPDSLEELNMMFQRWLEMGYNNRKHSAIGCPPIQKWMTGAGKVRMLPSGKIDGVFRFSAERQVRKDGTFSLKNVQYETSWLLSGRKVKILYDPLNRGIIEVFSQGISYGPARELNKSVNYTLRRSGGGK